MVKFCSHITRKTTNSTLLRMCIYKNLTHVNNYLISLNLWKKNVNSMYFKNFNLHQLRFNLLKIFKIFDITLIDRKRKDRHAYTLSGQENVSFIMQKYWMEKYANFRFFALRLLIKYSVLRL